jgi:CRISPR system Cascade subunit CasC
MTQFIEIHTLAALPASCMNRDRDSYPKTTEVGGIRGRVSSACLKRTWRTSEVFRNAFDGKLGARSRRAPQLIQDRLVAGSMDEETAKERAEKVAAVIGKVEKGQHKTMTFLSPGEIERLAEICSREPFLTDKDQKKADKALEKEVKDALGGDAVDIAMFGRMLAEHKDKGVEASVSVAHMFTVNAAEPEPDFFSAVDDLNPAEETGSGHMGDQYYIPPSVWYGYACIDRNQLVTNLGGDEEAAESAISALIKSAVTVYPTAKRSTFGTYGQASLAIVSRTQSPAHLAEAFLAPVGGNDILGRAVELLRKSHGNHVRVYDPEAEVRTLDVSDGDGTLESLVG